MRLRQLSISRFCSLGPNGSAAVVEFDNIVVLIGANNVGKSTVLDAYEAFATRQSLDAKQFHGEDTSQPVEIEALFAELSDTDRNTIAGKKWESRHDIFGPCIRAKYVWSAAGVPGIKHVWNPMTSDWEKGGLQGLDTLLQSVVPQPIRLRPTDSIDTIHKSIIKLLSDGVKSSADSVGDELKRIHGQLNELAAKYASSLEAELAATTLKVSQNFQSVFSGYSMSIKPVAADIDFSKLLSEGSHVRIRAPGSTFDLPLDQQGTGFHRAFLWSALQVISSGKSKSKKKPESDVSKILLIEEPEAFLHPPLVRAARESLYALAETAGWQVIINTHSPVFIDVSKPHTTIVRIDRDQETNSRIFSVERANFSDEDRSNLQMVRACNPSVAEFFFAKVVWLVEGETEHAVLASLLASGGHSQAIDVTIINCMGKGNIPLFAKILLQFKIPFVAIHDADYEYVSKAGKKTKNSMWSINLAIAECVEESRKLKCDSLGVVHIPGFEAHFFDKSVSRDKPYSAVKKLSDPSYVDHPKHQMLLGLAASLLARTHPYIYDSKAAFDALIEKWKPSLEAGAAADSTP